MEPNEKLLSVSRFQIGLSKADLQPSAGVCTTQALNKSRWSDFSPAPILEALSLEPSGPSCAMEIASRLWVIIWKEMTLSIFTFEIDLLY